MSVFLNKTIDCKISVSPVGTIFQQKIWGILLTILKEKTITYTEATDYRRNNKSVRAIGDN